jgi:SecD/SecF fusion protein
MSIDANVLIYERMRDEVRRGVKSRYEILKNGFSGALVGIVDSNVTTVLSAVTMIVFGSGFIRGFATSLIIGIACSLFSAVTFTKMVVDYFYIKRGFQIKLK